MLTAQDVINISFLSSEQVVRHPAASPLESRRICFSRSFFLCSQTHCCNLLLQTSQFFSLHSCREVLQQSHRLLAGDVAFAICEFHRKKNLKYESDPQHKFWVKSNQAIIYLLLNEKQLLITSRLTVCMPSTFIRFSKHKRLFLSVFPERLIIMKIKRGISWFGEQKKR